MRNSFEWRDGRISGLSRRNALGLIAWVVTMLLCPYPTHAQFATYLELSQSPLRIRNLPGRDGFTFTMYATPGSFEHFQALVQVMQDKNLGNGFDPGPGASVRQAQHHELLRQLKWPVVGYVQTSDHQVKEGTCRITDEQEAILQKHADAGLFAATQIGEWGYYFHKLSHDEGWWRAVYGNDFDNWKHLMKPSGLAGYDKMPKSKQECYDIVKDYFQTRQRHMRGWNLSITGHSHYEAYAGQWGAKLIGLELGENIAFTQSKIAFARGAARRNGLPWSIQVSPWFSGSCTGRGPLRVNKNGTAGGLDAGHSESFYHRMWEHAWFSGVAMLTPEASLGIFFKTGLPPYELTRIGKSAPEVLVRDKALERGVPWTPVAIVLDQYAGYNGYMGKPWGILEPTPGDLEVRDLFQEQLFPDSDHIHRQPFPENPEATYVRPTPFGEIYDVQLSDAPLEVLASYPVLLLAGDHEFESGFIVSLKGYVAGGGKLLLAQRHVEAMGKEVLASLGSVANVDRNTGSVEVLNHWTNPKTQRATAISNARLKGLSEELFPIKIAGDPVQYSANRTKDGWAVKIVNNQGVVKFPTKPVEFDDKAKATVVIELKSKSDIFYDWRTGESSGGRQKRLTLEPGQSYLIAVSQSR